MLEASRSWFRRNRTRFAVTFGVLGASYLVAQYVLGKISEARERMTSERIAKENLRRRFQQNQEDCTFTVLALLPTVAENVLDALPVENITHELQQQRAEKLGRNVASVSEVSPSEQGTSDQRSQAGVEVNDDARSQGSQTGQSEGGESQGEGFVHTSQMGASTFEGEKSAGEGDKAKEKGKSKPKKSKAQLWNDLKLQSITRAFTMIYTLSLLTLLTRIQLNLLGRRSYLSSVVSLASPAPQDSSISLENHDDDRGGDSCGNDFETNRKFLTFSWWLLHRGWKDMMNKVETAVREVFGPLNPREDLSFERLSHLVVEVRKLVEGKTESERQHQKWLPYLLPPPERETYVLQESGILGTPPSPSTSPPEQPQPDLPLSTSIPTDTASPKSTSIPPTDPLRRLLDETSDLLDSPTASHIQTLLLDALFSHLTDTVLRVQAYKLPPTNPPPSQDASLFDNSQRIVDVSDANLNISGSSSSSPSTSGGGTGEVRAKLATILAAVTRQAHAMGSGVPNEYVQAMEGVRELDAFAAVVYSSNLEAEGARVGMEVDEEDETEEVVVVESVTRGGSARIVGRESAGGGTGGGWGIGNTVNWVMGGWWGGSG